MSLFDVVLLWNFAIYKLCLITIFSVLISLCTLLFKCRNPQSKSTVPLVFEQYSLLYDKWNNVHDYYDFVAFNWNIPSVTYAVCLLFFFSWNSLEVRRGLFVAKGWANWITCKQTSTNKLKNLVTNFSIISHDSVEGMNLLTQEIFLTVRPRFQKWAFCFISLSYQFFWYTGLIRISP